MTATLAPRMFVSKVYDQPPHPLLASWSDWQKTKHLAPRTIDKRIRTVIKFADDRKINPVSACRDDITAWFADNDHWKSSTHFGYFSALHSWFSWLVLMEHRPDNPMAKLGRPTDVRGEPRPLSDAEVTQLLGTRMHHRTRVMIWLAALAGLRAFEIAKLKGSDIDLTRQVIWVAGKGGTKKTVPLHPLLNATVPTMPRTGYWFPSDEDASRPIHYRSVSSTLGRAMRRAGVSGTPHSLRHWYASTLLANGADLRTVQECLRHASIATTQVYTRVPDESRHEAVARLNPFGTDWDVMREGNK